MMGTEQYGLVCRQIECKEIYSHNLNSQGRDFVLRNGIFNDNHTAPSLLKNSLGNWHQPVDI